METSANLWLRLRVKCPIAIGTCPTFTCFFSFVVVVVVVVVLFFFGMKGVGCSNWKSVVLKV